MNTNHPAEKNLYNNAGADLHRAKELRHLSKRVFLENHYRVRISQSKSNNKKKWYSLVGISDIEHVITNKLAAIFKSEREKSKFIKFNDCITALSSYVRIRN